MTNITLRSVKGSPLTNNEVDSNFSSLNDFKVEQTDSTGSALIPSGTTAQRDGTPSAGMLRYNTSLSQFEGYITDWGPIGITNLTNTADSSSLTINSSSGTGTSLPAATTTTWGVMTDEDKSKLDGIESSATADQTITAGTGLSGGGTGDVTINHSNSITPGTVSEGGGARTLGYGGSFNIPSVTYDSQGHITTTTTVALTLPASDNTNTTYDLTVPESTTSIRLAGNDSTNDDVTITGGTNVTVTRTSATELTIDATGTVTSVGGTGTVNGLTLTGTVTTSGNLTLGGTLSGVTSSNFSATTTLLIKDSAGATLKTIRGPSS